MKIITITDAEDRLLNSIIENASLVVKGRKGVALFVQLDASINMNCKHFPDPKPEKPAADSAPAQQQEN